jgi:hypothetical protein
MKSEFLCQFLTFGSIFHAILPGFWNGPLYLVCTEGETSMGRPRKPLEQEYYGHNPRGGYERKPKTVYRPPGWQPTPELPPEPDEPDDDDGELIW